MGIWLTETFLWAREQLKFPNHLHILSRHPNAAVRKFPHLDHRTGIHFHFGDVRTSNLRIQPAYVLHAGCSSVGRKDDTEPLETWDTIVGGTRRMLEFAQRCKAKRFLLVSSGVAGLEWEPSDTRSVYAQAKRAAEHLCALFAKQSGLSFSVARCFTFIGPHLPLDAHYAAGNFIRDGLAGGPIIVKGDGETVRSYMYAADMAADLWATCLIGASGWTFNIGHWASTSTYELARTVADAFSPRLDIVLQNSGDTGVRRLLPESSGLWKDVTYVDLETAIEKTVSWHQQQRNQNGTANR